MTREISCHEAAGYLFAYLDGELEPRSTAEFLHHLETCRTCLGRTDFERRMMDFVRGLATTEVAPSDLTARIRRVFAAAGTADPPTE